ncbi:MAG: HYR domain-containing protein [Gaiellaceae bacterium]
MKSSSRGVRAVGVCRRVRWVALAAFVGVMVVAPSAGATVTVPPGLITVPSSGTFLYMNSQPGDYIGQGIEQLYTSTDSTITGLLPQGGDTFHASVIQGPFTHWWYVNIAAPAGRPLAVGSYTGAFRAPFRPAGSPGLDIYGDGRGCNNLTGQFDINEVSYAPTGELLVFDATFEQHCEGGSAALFGRIRIENPAPPPDVTPPTLNLSNVSVEAPDTSGTNVSYSATATDDRDPNPTVTCTPQSGSLFSVGTTTVNCQAKDRSGNVATGSFLVNVYAPLQFGLTISGQGMVSSKTGAATISGTLNCSRAIPVDLSGTVKQLVANRVYVTGTFSVHVNCAAPSTSWNTTLTGDNGKFGGGSANVTVDAFGCELSCHSASAAAAVRLNAGK